jgi:hypothetical protein
MYISLSYSTTNGFKKWADAQRPGNKNDDGPDEAAPTNITEPPSDDRAPIEVPPHQPWLVLGTGSLF